MLSDPCACMKPPKNQSIKVELVMNHLLESHMEVRPTCFVKMPQNVSGLRLCADGLQVNLGRLAFHVSCAVAVEG